MLEVMFRINARVEEQPVFVIGNAVGVPPRGCHPETRQKRLDCDSPAMAVGPERLRPGVATERAVLAADYARTN